MFKKLLIASAILAATTSAFAEPYVGASIGVNSNHVHYNNNPNSLDMGNHGVAGKVYAGYGARVNQGLYLGGEVFGDLTSTNGAGPGPVNLTQKFGYGASLLPGLMLNETTKLYGRVGVVRTRFNATSPEMSQQKTLTGGQLGLGLQTCVTQNVDLRGEYDYTRYGNTTLVGTKVSPSSSQVNLGIVYKFN